MSKLLCAGQILLILSMLSVVGVFWSIWALSFSMGLLILSVVLIGIDDVLDVETREFERTGRLP